jgi:hypothetical protein
MISPYTASQRFFSQPSAEELEEHEYQRALAVISNHHHRQAEKEAVTRRQQQAAAARQRHLASLAAELEQRRQQAELLASHHAKIVRTQRAQARLAAAECQFAVKEFLRQVCRICTHLPGLVLTLPQSSTCRPHDAKFKPLPDALKRRPASEPDADVSESIRDFLSSFGPRPTRLEKPKNFNEEPLKSAEDFLSSLFPSLVLHAQPAASTETAQSRAVDNRKEAALAADVAEPKGSARGAESADVASPPGPSNLSPVGGAAPPVETTVAETQQVQIDRTTSLSSVESIRSNLTKVQAAFAFPVDLDHYDPSTDAHDETASVSSTSSSDLTRLIPYTSVNKPVYKYEHELNGLLEELDKIDSHGDAEVRGRRKEVVKAVERALEGVERVIVSLVEKRLSLVGPSTPVIEEPLKGFDVGEDVIETGLPVSTEEQIDDPVAVGDVEVPEQSAPARLEAVAAVSVEESCPAKEIIPESKTLAVSDWTTTAPHVEFSPTEPNSRLPAQTPAPEPVEPTVTESKPQLPAEEAVLVLDSDEGKGRESDIGRIGLWPYSG